jgi:hypothetical protein
MMLKIILYARTFHYGQFLSMPAALLLVGVLVKWGPDFLQRRGADAQVPRFAAAALYVSIIIVHLGITAINIANKRFVVSAGADTFFATDKAVSVNIALRQIREYVRADQSLACLPEGVMINYLTRRANPTPYINILPPELIMFGEDNMVAAFDAHPPDFILLARHYKSDFVFPGFGQTYGQRLYAWVMRNYQRVATHDVPPAHEQDLGLVLMRRK